MTVSGYYTATVAAWKTQALIKDLPKAAINTYGALAYSGSNTAFVSVYAGSGTLRLETKDDAISFKNMFFAITYIAEA